MGSPRIKGTRLALVLDTSIDPLTGSPAPVDWWADLTAYSLESDPGNTSFVSSFPGDDSPSWWLRGSAIQSTAHDSLWAFTWEFSGETVGYRVAPHGNEIPTKDEPHFVGAVVIGPKAPIGGAAGTGTFIFEFEWQLTAEPTPVYAVETEPAP